MEKAAPIFVVFAAILWGIDGIVLRPTLFNLPVTLVVLIESSIVTLYLTPVFRKQLVIIKTFDQNDWIAFIGVAIFGGAIGIMAITKALFYVNYVNLSIVILIQKLQPVIALILAAVFLKERLPANFFLWATLAVIGTYFMTFGLNMPVIHSGDKTASAALFSLIAAASFAVSTIFSKRALKNVSFEFGTYLRFLFSSILLFVLVAASGELLTIKQVTKQQALIFILIAFSTGGPAIFLYYYGLKKIKASIAAICELAFPLSAILFEYLLRGRLLQPVQWLGAFVLIFSIFNVSKINGRKFKSQRFAATAILRK